MADLAAWCLTSDKIKLAELAEMTEGGATHPFFLTVLQVPVHQRKNQCSGSEIINYGSGSLIGKLRISNPDPGKYPITDPDPYPTFELQIDKKDIEIRQNTSKFVMFWS